MRPDARRAPAQGAKRGNMISVAPVEANAVLRPGSAETSQIKVRALSPSQGAEFCSAITDVLERMPQLLIAGFRFRLGSNPKRHAYDLLGRSELALPVAAPGPMHAAPAQHKPTATFAFACPIFAGESEKVHSGKISRNFHWLSYNKKSTSI